MRALRLGLLLAAVAMGADLAAQHVFERTREKVLDNGRRVPRYTCVQTINRTEYRPQYGERLHDCGELIGARAKLVSPGYIRWHDRLRLEVAVVDGAETFAWAGSHEFETTDIEQLTQSGSAGSGDFASFLRAVFEGGSTRISLQSEEVSPQGRFGLFTFVVPVEGSRYRYRSAATGGERTIGYHGEFLVDEEQAELRQLTVDADHFPEQEEMCRVEDVMDYHRVKVGGGDFLLPETSKMTVLFRNGQESQNQTQYSDCREYVGESTIHFGGEETAGVSGLVANLDKPKVAPPPPIPVHLRLQIGLKSPIHSETAAAGDVVTGVILREVRDAGGRVVASAGDTVHGRILRLEQFLFPAPRWVMAIRFDALEHSGQSEALSLTPIDDGRRTRATRRDPVLEVRPAGSGVFIFQERGNLELGEKFRSEWETE